jgi:CubicO group peptidase (beta-lactamase class C family)
MKRITIFFVSIVLCFASLAQPSFVKDSLDAYIQKGIADWQIPGLAIAIVKDGKTIVMKGYGVRNLETKEPVDENTLFIIASNSKLFTGTALAQIEYNKKLSLEDKITKYFPDFKLYDSNITKMVTIRDMLSHRLGTKTFQGDFTFWDSKLSRKEIMQRMRYLKPPQTFRQDFGYCNSCFLTAGEVIPKVTGKPWEVYVYDSIVQPLGMTNTHMLTAGIAQRSNVATPYTTQFTNQLQQLPYDEVDNLAPAGSMVSCVKDVAKWLTMQLDSGRYEGKRILPWQVLAKTRRMNTVINSTKSKTYPTHFYGYGLGVFIGDYNGKQVYEHTGGAFGFVTNTCFIPEENLAITILTNNDNQNFFELLRKQIIDAYVNVPYVNRSEQQLANFKEEMAATAKQITVWKNRLTNQQPTQPLTAYTGTYENELYGTITITQKQNDLQIKFNSHNNLTATLQYMDANEWLMTYNNAAFGIFTTKFTLVKDKVISVEIKANDFVEYDPYVFKKK